ncbi:MAG TPA: c-type cytochrome, partial [Novosphingobium sp.]|nr:c-type cytochrome [Novosphingobium sp.]
LLVFALDGKDRLPPYSPPPPPTGPIVAAMPADATAIAAGDRLFGRFCLRCHGSGAVSAGAYPDLRLSPQVMSQAFEQIVLKGALAPAGMPGFAGKLNQRDLAAIRAYLGKRSYEDFGGKPQPGKGTKP